ncbi:MAG: oligosaccharide flippase family protein, partial [Archaeoglobaceae archaeon]
KMQLNDPLFKNSFFILLSSAESAIFGFFFWFTAAKLYTAEAIGLATAMISSLGLLNSISRLGFDQSIIRFLPEMDKNRIFWTSAMFTAIFSAFLGLIFISFIEFFSPSLIRLRDVFPVYLLFLLFCSITATNSSCFIAMRRAEIDFIQKMLLGSRILLLIPLAFLGVFGIFFSVGLAYLIAIIFSLGFLIFKFGFKFYGIDKKFLQSSIGFSAGNYVANLLGTLPSMIMPIMVLNLLGAEQNAIYYIAYTIGAFVFIIPSSFGTSLFVEGSYRGPIRKKTIKSIFGTYALLFPAVLGIIVLGEYLLVFLGKHYEAGLSLLRIFAVSSLFAPFFSVYSTIKRVQKDLRGLIAMSFLLSALLIFLSFSLMLVYGIIGVGYAWLFSYAFCSIIVILLAKRNGWISLIKMF